MSLTLKAGEPKDFEPHPPGFFNAVCVTAVDLGLVHNEYYNKTQRQVYLLFETDQLRQDGTPWTINGWYTADITNSRAKLKALLEGWRDKPFEKDDTLKLEKLAGQSCKLAIEGYFNTKGEKRSRITSAQPAEKQLKPVADLITDDNWLEGPEWLQERILRGQKLLAETEAQNVQPQPETMEEELDDEVPF